MNRKCKIILQLEPYMIEIIHGLVRRCCGVCPTYNYTDKRISDVSKIPDVADNNSTDFVFPVLGLNSVCVSQIIFYDFLVLPIFVLSLAEKTRY